MPPMGSLALLACKNLWRNPLRVLLTLLGVATGIALLVSVSGYGNSIASQLQQVISNRYQLVIMSQGAPNPMTSRITEAELDAINAVQGIEVARPVVIGSLQHQDRLPFFLIIGVESGDTLAGNLGLLQGRWFAEDRDELLLGYDAARRLQIGTGDTLALKQRQFEISGLYGSESNMLNQAGIVGTVQAQRLLDSEGRYNVILVKLARGAGIKNVTARLARQVPHLEMTRSVDLLGRLTFFVMVDQISTVLGWFAIVFCTLITTNTMLMSLQDRRREIALLIALGWTRAMIAWQLIVESLVIATVGATLGLLLGYATLYQLSQSDIPRFNWGQPALTVEMLLVVGGVTVAISLASAIYPVFVSARISAASMLQRA